MDRQGTRHHHWRPQKKPKAVVVGAMPSSSPSTHNNSLSHSQPAYIHRKAPIPVRVLNEDDFDNLRTYVIKGWTGAQADTECATYEPNSSQNSIAEQVKERECTNMTDLAGRGRANK